MKTSVLLIAVIGLLLYLDVTRSWTGYEGLWLLPVLLFFAVGTAWDLSGLVIAGGRSLSRRMAILATLVVTLSPLMPMFLRLFGIPHSVDVTVGPLGWIVVAAIVAVMLTIGREMFIYGRSGTTDSHVRPEVDSKPINDSKQDSDSKQNGVPNGVGIVTERIATTVFVAAYVGLPMALLFSLRSLGSGSWGMAALLTMVAVTKSSDAGAYFVGRALGRHKLIPRLSPGKTVEGAIGGVLASTIVALVCLHWLFPFFLGTASSLGGGIEVNLSQSGWPPLWGALILGPILAVAGMLGDLAESLVKRDAAAKDSGSLLPGLGGVWDVTDSLISAIMPAFLCFSAGVAGPIV